MDERRPGPQWPSMCYRGLEVKGHWQNLHPLPEPHFVSIGAKVGPKVVTVRRKCFIFLRELVKIAFVSVWSSMKILCGLMYISEEPSFQFSNS